LICWSKKEEVELYQLLELFILRGAPEYLRSDNGSEFAAEMVQRWLSQLGVKTVFIEPFNGKLRDELLNGEIFNRVLEENGITERWRRQYSTIRPHSSLAHRPPAPEAFFPRQVANDWVGKN